MKSSLLLISLLFIGSYGYSVGVSSIDSSYGTASHNTTKWQELATYDGLTKKDDNGVFWSVDGGANWGHEDLTVGQTVLFQFNMHKQHVGTHYADHLKAWLDRGETGPFEESDLLIYEEVLLPEGDRSQGGDGTTRGADVVSGENYTFTTTGLFIDASYIGSLSLRARVTCSESLSHDSRGDWDDQWEEPLISTYNTLFTATGNLNQGEVEEWTITVNPVSDSGSTFALFGAALLGLGFLKRRKAA